MSFAPKRVLSLFLLVMLNIAIMASLRNLPLVAKLGYQAIPFFLIVALIFLIPSALVSAELATGWPKSGGVYIWVREAFGDKAGFFTIWMQWAHNLTWYPAILSFIAATISYAFFPSLKGNPYYILSVVIVSFWVMTFINYFGIKTSSIFSTVCVIVGTLIPGLFVISLGITWIFSAETVQIPFSATKLIPDFSNFDHLVFIIGLFLAFSGLEVSAGYAGEVKNPQKNYPKSIIFAAAITFVIFLFGALSIAVVLPEGEISLVAGLMEAFKVFLAKFHLSFLLPVLAIMLICGALGETNSWIIGPVKALHTTSLHGNLPPFLQKINNHGMPTNLLFLQAIVVTISSFVFLLMPSLSTSYWILSAISAQMYLIMYVMMFISAIRLRYVKPHIPRAYKIPHPHKGIWVVAGIGTMSSLLGIVIGFFPPSQLETGNPYLYEGLLIGGLLIMVAAPLVIHAFKSPHWTKPYLSKNPSKRFASKYNKRK